jgi:protease I
MKKVLVIIAHRGFQDHEFEGTVNGLRGSSYEVRVASTEKGTCVGKFGGEVEATIALRDVVVDEFDRIAFIGGPGARELMDNPDAHRIAQETVKAGKVLGAICIAPTILAKAGVLRGKKATVWNEDNQADSILTREGAQYTGESVTVDGRIITANGPKAAEEFGKIFAK